MYGATVHSKSKKASFLLNFTFCAALNQVSVFVVLLKLVWLEAVSTRNPQRL